MEHNDLSDRFPARYIWWWENVVANPPAPRSFTLGGRRGGKWLREAQRWSVDNHVSSLLWDVAGRRGVRCELVTSHSSDPRWLEALDTVVSDLSLPFTGTARHMTPRDMEFYLNTYAGRSVVGVLHPYVERPMLFGSRGVVVGNSRQLQL